MTDMRQTLTDFKKGVGQMMKHEPEVWKAWANFMNTAMKDSALDAKTKELIALGMGITARCKYCIGVHVQKCLELGVSEQEILDVCTIAMMMGGGPAMTYIAEVEKALNMAKNG